MSRKYHTKHRRTRSKYKETRAARGLNGVSARMPKLAWLRKHQGADPLLVAEAERMGI